MIIIAGKTNLSIYILERLLKYNESNYLGVIPSSDDIGKDYWQLSLKKYANNNNIKIYNLEDIYNVADIFISCEYERIINVNKFKTRKIFNYHFSLLPKYRGVYTSIWPILNNDNYAGLSIHLMTNKIDSGKIILRKQFKVEKSDCSFDIYLKNILFGKILTNKFINLLNQNKYKYLNNNYKRYEYKSKSSFNFSDLKINFNDLSTNINKKIRAMCFRPYQLPMYKEKKIVNSLILKKISKNKPGTIVKKNRFYFEVSTIDYNIFIFEDKLSEIIKYIKLDDIKNVKKLLNNIININDRDSKLRTPIIIAAIYSSKKCIKLFNNLNADLNLEDMYQKKFEDYI